MPKVILDAGHGGRDIGEIYQGRLEKDDNLKLTLAVGNILSDNGIDVAYTRTTDIYLPQLERVRIINEIGGDLLVSIHRTSGDYRSVTPSLDFFILNEGALAEQAAINIAKELSEVTFVNNGIVVRTDIPILSKTTMPGVMVGIGNIKSEEDNELFDKRLDDIAQAIADGIIETLQGEGSESEKHQTKTPSESQSELAPETEQIPNIAVETISEALYFDAGYDNYQYYSQLYLMPEESDRNILIDAPTRNDFKEEMSMEGMPMEEVPIESIPEVGTPMESIPEDSGQVKQAPVEERPISVKKVPIEKVSEEPLTNVEGQNTSYRYKVQVGLFRIYNNALNLQLQLLFQSFPTEIVKQGVLYAVQVGDYPTLDEAADLQTHLRNIGYDTLLVAV